MDQATISICVLILALVALLIAEIGKQGLQYLSWKFSLIFCGLWCFKHHCAKEKTAIPLEHHTRLYPHKDDPDWKCPICH